VVRRNTNWVVVQGDLEDGQFVCATRLQHALPGMEVQIAKKMTLDSSGTALGEVIDLSAVLSLAALPNDAAAVKE
jgi:hypothetical protein